MPERSTWHFDPRNGSGVFQPVPFDVQNADLQRSEQAMTNLEPPGKLVRPVDGKSDHVLGNPGAEITLVEYGSYVCSHCRAANEEIARVRDQFGERLRYVFRHLPISGSDIARRAAELAETTDSDEDFWRV